MAELTPMMRQYLALKEAHPGALLFFRLGDFYEMFFEDAITTSRELELTLTGRDCGMEERAPMCGVPWHAVDGYVARLIARGYKVAIAEQTEEPAKGKTLVKREVVRIITPGTFSDTAPNMEKQNCFLAAAYFAGKRAGAAVCDVSTGELFVQAFPEGDSALFRFLQAHGPREVITNDEERLQAGFVGYVSPVRAESFRLKKAREQLLRHFSVASPQALGLADKEDLLISPVGALLAYLGDTQKVDLAHITRLAVIKSGDSMPLPPSTVKSLELVESLSGPSGLSLYKVLDRTRTAMGGRLLRTWVLHPLLDLGQIGLRLDAVAAFVDSPLLLAETEALLDKVYDLERLLSKLSYRTLGPRDALALYNSLQQAPMARQMLQNQQAPGLLAVAELLLPQEQVTNLLDKALSPDAPVLLSDGGVIKEGYDGQLDQARLAARDGRQWLSDLESREREATGIKNLKIQYNRVFGYFFEVTKSNYALVPERFIRRQTLANAERYTTQELGDLERRALGAQEEAAKREQQLYQQLLDQLGQYIQDMQRIALGFKTLDALQSLARVARDYHYCRPVLNQEGRLDIKDGRHPVVERALPEGNFVPNDSHVADHNRMLIVTGPNMGGKSTWMRQTALIVLLAHMGSFVPAEYADIPILDNVFTRIGAQDDLASGQSTFMVEMTELSFILRNATPNSLVVLDEIGRGTSTLDGLSIAWAAVEHLADPVKSGAITLFATHYHELSGMEGALPGVNNLSVTTKEVGEEVIFLHKIKPGAADKSFGVYVARMAGVPLSVVQRAREILARLEANDITQDAIGKNILEKKKKKGEQLSLGETQRAELVLELAQLDVLQMSPMEALNQLFVLKEKARKI